MAGNTNSEETRATCDAIELVDNAEVFFSQPLPFVSSLNLGDVSGQVEWEVSMDESEDYTGMPSLIWETDGNDDVVKMADLGLHISSPSAPPTHNSHIPCIPCVSNHTFSC